ncbi:MAG: DNA-formamidopyrimidine glycosylase family protein, partial [bacterium]
MPELPEVETVIRALKPVLEGKTIERVELLHPRVWRDSDPERLHAATRNARITNLDRRGKHILWHLENRPTLVIHLRMSGQLLLSDSPINSPHVRAVFHLKGGPLVHFVDARTFGTLFLLDGTEPASFHALGVEPLSSEFTPRVLAELMRDRTTPVKSFLLMQ